MTKDEALKLALEALELHGQQYPHMVKGYCLDAITAIKEVLAQHDSVQAKPEPEQEIVAWMYEQARFGPTDLRGQQWKLALSRLKPWTGNGLVRNVQALYTTPPQEQRSCDRRTWVGLTDEEIGYYIVHSLGTATKKNLVGLIRLCEAKLKEKNK